MGTSCYFSSAVAFYCKTFILSSAVQIRVGFFEVTLNSSFFHLTYLLKLLRNNEIQIKRIQTQIFCGLLNSRKEGTNSLCDLNLNTNVTVRKSVSCSVRYIRTVT